MMLKQSIKFLADGLKHYNHIIFDHLAYFYRLFRPSIMIRPIKPFVISLVLWTAFLPSFGFAEDALSRYSALQDAGLLLVDTRGNPLISDHPSKPFIPASTVKLVTAWLALIHWGEDYRFQTDFFLDTATDTLWVKGSGDPFLISEELERIASKLKLQGLTKIKAIGLDTSLFQQNLLLPGTEHTNNPYDAVPSAVAANFNTINVKKVQGRVVSAESQTPLTDYAKTMSRQLKKGILRVNTGRNPHDAEKYFAELLAAFLRKQGVVTEDTIIIGQVPVQEVYYSHLNSRTLAEIIRPMLEYSTNFIANQLVLVLSAEAYQTPANPDDVQRYMEEKLVQHFHWKNFTLKDGAGLSRENHLSPAQLVELLQAFRPWKHLMPEIEPGVFAKSGTLNNVSTLAGYIVKNDTWEPFALMMNESVPYLLRNRIARELAARNEGRETHPI